MPQPLTPDVVTHTPDVILAPDVVTHTLDVVVLEPDVINATDASLPDVDMPSPFDLEQVQWLHPNISQWNETTALSVSFANNLICLDYDKKDEWPLVEIFGSTDVVANAWVFAQQEGQWYGMTFEWLRPGQTCKAMSAVEGGHIKVAPFDEASQWAPALCEELYFMVSGLIRSPAYRNVSERSNIVRVTWPQ